MRVVGLDWAVAAKSRAAVIVEKSVQGNQVVAGVITNVTDQQTIELCQNPEHAVVAVDIPFAWPRAFGEFVHHWSAVEESPTPPPKDRFRYRITDLFVQQRTGKWPLSVSTNLFALGALHWAQIVHDHRLKKQIVVEQRPSNPDELPMLIEVYPGASIRALRCQEETTYKSNAAARRQLVRSILDRFQIECDQVQFDRIVSTGKEDHATDALIAAITALMFLGEIPGWRTYTPDQSQLQDARQEGWIFFPAAESALG